MHLVNVLLHICILEDLLDRFHGLTEEIKVKLLKLGMCSSQDLKDTVID
jgi:hypothetical protein